MKTGATSLGAIAMGGGNLYFDAQHFRLAGR